MLVHARVEVCPSSELLRTFPEKHPHLRKATSYSLHSKSFGDVPLLCAGGSHLLTFLPRTIRLSPTWVATTKKLCLVIISGVPQSPRLYCFKIYLRKTTRTKILHCVSSIGEAYGFSGFLLLIIGSAQRQFFVLLPGYSVQVIEVMLASRELSIYLSIRCVFTASICLLCPLLAVAVKPFCNAVIFHMSSDHFSC